MTSWLVIDRRNGKQICECGSINDAVMMRDLGDHRDIHQKVLILDQIVDVSSERLPDDRQLKAQKILNKSDAVPFKG